MILANANGSNRSSSPNRLGYFVDDYAYIEHIKQKEIHEDLATHPVFSYREEDFCRFSSFPDQMGSFRVAHFVKQLKKHNFKKTFVQIPCPDFDYQTYKGREGYYLKSKQKEILLNALLDKKIDVVVLSLPEYTNLKLPKGVALAAITERLDPAYALLQKQDVVMQGKDTVIVSSLSLAQQLRGENTDFWCLEKSYNFSEAINFLELEQAKGVIIPLSDILLAQDEIDLTAYSYSVLAPQKVVPPAGQGASLVLVREEDEKLKDFLYKHLHHHATAYSYEWEKKASVLIDYLPERSGAFMALRGKEYNFHLYNPQMIKPFQRLATHIVGDRNTGVDLRKFNTLLHGVYGELSLIGLGPGSMRFLTIEAERYLRQADVVYGMGSSITSFSSLFSVQCKFIDLEQDERFQSMSYLLQTIRTELLLGLKVSICLNGDPFFLNVGITLSSALTTEGIPFKVLSGMSPLLSMAAQEGVPLIQAGISSACHIFDGRNRQFLNRFFSSLDGTFVFYVRANQISAVIRRLEEENFDPDLPCLYLMINQVGGKNNTIKGRLGSYFRKLGEVDRNIEGYFIVGEAVNLSKLLNTHNYYEHPLSNQNILFPVIKELSEEERHWIDFCESLGAHTVIFRLGTPLITKKCKENLRQLLNHLTTGTLRLASPVRIKQDLGKEGRNKKISPLKKFNKGKIYLVFHTSIGVEVFFKVFREEGYDLRLLAGYTFVAANSKVYHALGEEGIHADYWPEHEDAEYLANLLLRNLSFDDYILSFNYEGKTSLFESILLNAKMYLISVGIYVQQFRLPSQKQLLNFIDSCNSFLFTESSAAVGMITAMISAGFDHDMILSRSLKILATTEQVKSLLETSGFKVKLIEKPSDLTEVQ